MKKFIYLILVLFSVACKKNLKKNPQLNIPKNYSLIIGNPLDEIFENTLLFPLGANYNPEITGQKNENLDIKESKNGLSFYNVSNANAILYDTRASNEYVNNSEDLYDIRNILFYNKSTGASYPLTKDTLHILSFAIHKEFKKHLIFYRVVKKDINKDKIYNKKDAVMLYTSDLNGNNFTAITPENEQFIDYFYYPENNVILVKTTINIDNNTVFDEKDETNYRELNINEPKLGREIFNKSFKDSLKAQIKSLN